MDAARLLLSDGDRLLRDGLKKILRGRGFFVAGEVDSLAQARLWLEHAPAPVDLVLCDIEENSEKELQLIAAILREFAPTKIVVLARHLSSAWLGSAMGCGVSGFISKTVAPQAFLCSLKCVLLGGRVISSDCFQFVPERVFPGRAAPAIEFAGNPAALSTRERDILRCLASGRSNKEIARKLSIAEATVKVHLKGLLRKIKVVNRTQAAIWAIRNGSLAAADPAERSGEIPAVAGKSDLKQLGAPAPQVNRRNRELPSPWRVEALPPAPSDRADERHLTLAATESARQLAAGGATLSPRRY